MKVSINLLKQFTKLDIPDEKVVELVKEHIGEVDYYHNLQEDYKDIVIAQIKEKKDHPDADKLGIYKLDYGNGEEIQVVAGDKNLNVGDKVTYMKVGSTVPYSIYTEVKPFTIKSVKLRGVQSNGMMGSERELNLGTDHERVMVLPNDAPIGESFSKYYDLNDTVIDIENKALTNRGDLFGILGIARELSTIVGQKFTSPDWYINPKKNIKHEKNCLKVEIVNDAEILCPRYTAIALDEINITQSPIWLKSALIKCDFKPINNVVDITNYIALLIGQPLHAFDYDKLISNDPNNKDCAYINIRLAKHDEKILALDEKLYELNEDAIVIADSTHPIGIAGVIGGKDTEVDANTKRIVLESANFDKSSIRRTSMKLGIFTEAATRFKHNLDTNMCIAGLLKAVELLKELSDCKIASNVIDIYNQKYEPKSIQFSTEDLNSTLGTQMDTSTVVSILQNLEYQVQKKNILYITPPSWRRDVEIKEDIYEDIGRIYGFNNINIVLPKKSITPPLNNKIFSTKKIIRNTLSNKGANETLSYSFTDINSFEKCNLDSNLAYRIKNALSPELSLMRTCILQSLLSKAKENVERGIDKFALYEINIAHINNLTEESKLPIESWHTSLILTNSKKDSKKESPYYVAKKYLEYVFQSLSIPSIEYSLVSESPEIDLPVYIKNMLAIFEPNGSALISIHGVVVGIVGEISNSVKSNFKLPGFSSGFEINVNELSKIEGGISKYKEQPIYPSFSYDLCFEMSSGVKYLDIYDEIVKILNSNDLWGRVECLDIYQDSKTEDNKRITFRITASNYSKTLKEKDIKSIVSKIEKKLKEKLDIKLI